MELVKITEENIDREHICCAISNDKALQVMSKKTWLLERFADGLVFLKGNVRGKCFIEYIPAENAWAPVKAEGYMMIDCLWVSGQYKGHGNADLLLETCIHDSKQKRKAGLCVLSSKKKKPFLSDARYLAHKGFHLADIAEPYFELWYLAFDEYAVIPSFCLQVKNPHITQTGLVIYYSHQCPFTAKYVPLLIQTADRMGVDLQTILIDSKEKAQGAPAAVTSFSLFYNGSFVTHEILSIKKFETLVTELTKGGNGYED